MNVKEPRDRLETWVLDLQDFDFNIHHASGTNLVLPDTPNRDAVNKPLCQRFYRPLIDELEEVCVLREATLTGNGPTGDETKVAQMEKYGDVI